MRLALFPGSPMSETAGTFPICFDISLETMSNSVVLFVFEFDTKFKWIFLFQPILPNTLLPLVHNRSLSFPNIVLNTFKLST